jgi:hypothetical protein
METLERERDYWREETQRGQVVQGQLAAQCAATNAQLEEANERSRHLREKLLEMQRDLFAEDFPPTLICAWR